MSASSLVIYQCTSLDCRSVATTPAMPRKIKIDYEPGLPCPHCTYTDATGRVIRPPLWPFPVDPPSWRFPMPAAERIAAQRLRMQRVRAGVLRGMHGAKFVPEKAEDTLES